MHCFEKGVYFCRTYEMHAWPVQARSQLGFEGFSRTPNFCTQKISGGRVDYCFSRLCEGGWCCS